MTSPTRSSRTAPSTPAADRPDELVARPLRGVEPARQYDRAVHLAGPRSLRVASEVAARRALLHRSATAIPLTRWVDDLIAQRHAAGLPAQIPYADPLDAGVAAQVLLVLEAPGPMTNALLSPPGSGFISSDNDDATAENLWWARKAAGLESLALIWNAVPWYLGPTTRKPLVEEQRIGGEILRNLVAMLPELHTVVVPGTHARETWRRFTRPNLGIAVRTIESFHSGRQAMNQPGRRAHLHAALTRAANDWRALPIPEAEIVWDRDHAGQVTNAWYLNDDGDRVDIHPRWW